MRMLTGQIFHILDSEFVGAVRRLYIEIDWVKRSLKNRSAYFDGVEWEIIQEFIAEIERLRAQIPAINAENFQSDLRELKKSGDFQGAIRRVYDLQVEAVGLILSVTNEDEAWLA
jgi:hypothetical protein